MKKSLKRNSLFLSIVLCFCVVLTSLVPLGVIVAKHNKEIDSLNVSIATAKMNRENNAEYINIANNANDKTVEIPTRLVVETTKHISLPDDVETVYSSGFAFIQCKNEKRANEIKELLDEKKYEYFNDYYAKATNEEVNGVEYPKNWAYDNVESADAISKLTTSQKTKRINIMVVDTGVNYNHAGLITRVTEHSLNFSSSGNENSAKDDQGHGTNVAGTIVKSTPSNVKIIALKLLDENGSCTFSSFYACLEYIANLENPPNIVNMSLGFPVNSSTAQSKTNQMCKNIINNSIIGVCAAGNDNTTMTITHYPSGCPDFIAVGATDIDGGRAVFSDYNSNDAQYISVDVAAPGVHVDTYQMDSLSDKAVNGTSFSSPLTVAASAIILMQDEGLNCQQVESILMERATRFYTDRWYYIPKQTWYYRNWVSSGTVNFYSLLDGDRVGNVDYEIISDEIDYSDLKVTFSCEDANTTIYYTTDGSRPTKSSSIYTVPIEITEFTRLCAVAYSNSSTKKLHSYYCAAELIPEVTPEIDSSVIEVDSRCYVTKYTGKKTSIYLDEYKGFKIRGIAEGAFENSDIRYVILNEACEIEKNAFKNSSLEKIYQNTIKGYYYPDNKDIIEDREHYYHTTTKVVDIVGESAFEGCKNLTSVNLDNMIIIGKNAFKDCTSLTEIPIKFGTNIGEGAFMNTGLTSISLPFCNAVPDNAFYGSKAETISVPKAKSVGENAFSGTNLKNVDLSSVEQFIGKSNFVNCTSLKTLDIPNSTNIPTFTFDEDAVSNMTSIYAPKAKDFNNNTSDLSTMQRLNYIYAPSLEKIGKNVLLPNTTLYTTSHLSSATQSSHLNIIGFENTFAQRFANENNNDFVSIDGHKFMFSSFDKDCSNFVCSDCNKSISFPMEILDKEYSKNIINKYASNENYLIMFDIVTDGVINAKDYAKYYHLEKYGW